MESSDDNVGRTPFGKELEPVLPVLFFSESDPRSYDQLLPARLYTPVGRALRRYPGSHG